MTANSGAEPETCCVASQPVQLQGVMLDLHHVGLPAAQTQQQGLKLPCKV